jgi:hypothetical protein
MKNLVLITSAFVLVLAACKKKEYPVQPTTGTPEFYVKATVENQPILFQAGTGDYYMYSSYEQNADGLYSFIANIKQKSCGVACPSSLKIELFDNQSSTANGESNINTSIKPGDYQFVNSNTVIPTIVGYAVTYSANFNLSTNTYSWNFGYGASYTGTNTAPTHTYATAGVYNVRFGAFDGNTWSYIDNPIKVTTNPNACRARIKVGGVSGNIVTFSSQATNGSGSYTRQLDFGDGTQPSPDVIAYHNYSPTGPGLYYLSLRVVDSQNDTAYHNYWCNTELSNSPAPNFYADKVTAIYSNSPIAKVRITYTDAAGTVYYSDADPQTTSSNFQITSVEDYKNNENSQATKKVKITFNCKLYSSSNTAVNITGGEAVIAVAYK